MAISNFDRSFSLTLRHEGGYVDHPKDPGGATNLGVTIGTLSAHLGRPATKAEVKALTPSAVSPIYRSGYWNKVKGDALPLGVDFAVYDYAVNSGPKRAIIALQRALEVADDGKLGPITLAKATAANPLLLCTKICSERLSFLRKLSTWSTFGKGWTRRVVGVEQEAVRMAREGILKPVAKPPAPTKLPPPPDDPGVDPAAVEPPKGFWASLFNLFRRRG
jgi:lysozyme family protein